MKVTYNRYDHFMPSVKKKKKRLIFKYMYKHDTEL